MEGNWPGYMILLICITAAYSEYYSSVHEILKLVDYERFLLGKMEKFVTLNENKLDYLKEKLDEFEGDRMDGQGTYDTFFEDPVNNYLLVKRLSMDWEKLENFLDHEVGINILKSVNKFWANHTFPGEDDVNGAIEGMLRLQRIYRLNTSDIVQGILGDGKYMAGLSAKDCFDIGKFALKQDNLLLAHAWLTEALKIFDSYAPTEIDGKLEKPDILEPLAEVKFKLSDFYGAAEMSYALMLWRPYDKRLMDVYMNYTHFAHTRASYKVESEHEPIPSYWDDMESSTEFEFTCSEHILQPTTSGELRCGYVTRNTFLRLAPVKVEEVSLDPFLVVFHDVIYDSEIKRLIELAKDRMERSRIASDKGYIVSDSRTSQVAYIPKEADTVLQTIDQRVADITGLNMKSAEDPQVGNYGVGGHYREHFDFFRNRKNIPFKDEEGNRIATVLFYLSDVEQGGGTAFPAIRKLIKPEKGAAAFWFNLFSNGDGDTWTKHGACPVLVGSKWVLNRWIRERGQEFTVPCFLTNDADEHAMKF